MLMSVLMQASTWIQTNHLSLTKQRRRFRRKWKLIGSFKMFGHQIPCAKVVIDFDGEVNTIRCHVCTHMKGKEKLSIPKFNSLQNDVNRCKCKVARPNCNMFNNIRNMSTWNHNTQTMNFSTFKERDTVTEQQVTPIMWTQQIFKVLVLFYYFH